MPHIWRLVDSGLVRPAESVAMDDAILEAHIAGAVPNTRHYDRRAVPTISVGYFQKVRESLDLYECTRRGISIVRRKSGGSSIYTDAGQLIYGLVVREMDLPEVRAKSFEFVCSAIARAISSFGVDAKFRPLNDVEVGGRKLSGNAQLRRKGSVLQHGTVIVDTDVCAMDAVLRLDRSKTPSIARPSDRITTLASLLGSVPDMELVKSRLSSEFARAFGVRFEKEGLVAMERETVRRLVEERYSRDEWNLKF
ncbi:MAG: lipoate--protein ligase family protein [Thermoplasmata archaeon]